MNRLFSYGTLRLPEVQRANFGRLLEGAADRLPGWRLDSVTIRDPAVVGLSGTEVHRIVRRGGPSDAVEGVVLLLSDDELAAADAYETDDYARVECVMASGAAAFVYVAAEDG